MTFDPALADLMADTVVIRLAARPGADGASLASTAAGSTRPARVTTDPKAIDRASGDVEGVNAIAWINSTGPIPASARITLPDGSVPPILSVSNIDDETGFHHAKVMFGG